ncbi:MAG: histidinol dehydrogenase [Alphaproteobacteria bacterium RIFOXYD12_FULL_60_8]|nr:MAG: histidinol dehydrogenase [Alphaproteobacteria bacterium RIFOXYD12_FULL_60_8]
MARRLDHNDPGFAAAFDALIHSKRETDSDVNDVVTAILKDVREQGDAAVIAYTARFDRQTLTPETLRVTPEEVDAAARSIPAELNNALTLASDRIRAYHTQQKPRSNQSYTDAAGVRLGTRWTPVNAAGLYVPGGTAAYPSSVLMNAIPAQVAGVERLVMVAPTPGGVVNPLVLAAAKLAGVSEIYRIGGAQAVGALAYGTQTIQPVDKIVGPGNAYVAAAKRQVFGTVGIDMIAGPSEILIIADGKNDPAWIAADLLSQAEHDTAAQSLLITDDPAFADAVEKAVETHLRTLGRETIARASWADHGAIITVKRLADAIPLANRIAPEHLELAVDDPDTMAETITNAGAIFLGRHTPEAMGDYIGGPNHVLPTARSARFSSGLSVLDFMKRTSLLGCDADSLRLLGPAAIALAEAEGLDAHGRSISIRLNL